MKVKKLVIINLILLIILTIIPNVSKLEIIAQEAVEVQTNNDLIEVSRSLEQPRQLLTIKNTKLLIDSDLRIPSNLEKADYEKMLSNTKLFEIADALVEAENQYQINGLYLMGLACLESSYGNSNFAKTRNNIVGWNAVDSNPGKASYFESKSECILYVAKKLQQNYLTETGTYFEGYTAKDIDVHYCTDKQHANKIIKIVNKLVKEL